MPDARGDSDLITRAQGGDVSAVGALYDKHHESVFKYLWLRVGERQLAEDLTGDVFTRMLSALPNYRSTAVPFRAWLYRIAHNLVVDHIRRSSKRVLLSLDAVEAQVHDDPVVTVERNMLVERVGHALAELDQHQREVVVLRFVLGLSLKEVAQVIDRTEAAVKSLQHRGLVTARAALNQEQEQVLR